MAAGEAPSDGSFGRYPARLRKCAAGGREARASWKRRGSDQIPRKALSRELE